MDTNRVEIGNEAFALDEECAAFAKQARSINPCGPPVWAEVGIFAGD